MAKTKTPSYWIGNPGDCDLCGKEITTGFSDARLPRHGCWGNVCPACATFEGVRYGTGYGQRYERVVVTSPIEVDLVRYLKVEG